VAEYSNCRRKGEGNVSLFEGEEEAARPPTPGIDLIVEGGEKREDVRSSCEEGNERLRHLWPPGSRGKGKTAKERGKRSGQRDLVTVKNRGGKEKEVSLFFQIEEGKKITIPIGVAIRPLGAFLRA